MDIAKMSTMMSQAYVQQQASLSVMKMIMDNEKEAAGEMVEMLNSNPNQQQAPHPHLGGSIDVRA
jgi:hypothetical protein